jgi:hypothetical protein
MQDAGYGLPRIPLPRRWVNKGKRKGQGVMPRPSQLWLSNAVFRLFRLMRDNLTLCNLGWVWEHGS